MSDGELAKHWKGDVVYNANSILKGSRLTRKKLESVPKGKEVPL
jgi:hypothetical protein